MVLNAGVLDDVEEAGLARVNDVRISGFGVAEAKADFGGAEFPEVGVGPAHGRLDGEV